MDNQPPQEPQAPTPITPQTPTPVAPQTPPQQQQPPLPPSENKKVPSLLGTIGLSLAFLGIIISLVPATVILGMVVLFAAFVLSLIALFKKNTLKWPAIVGLIVSAVAGVIVGLIFVITLVVNLADDVNENNSTKTPSTSEQTNNSSNDQPTTKRMSTEEIAPKLQVILENEGLTGYRKVPNFYPCMAKEIYESDIPNEALRISINGGTASESEEENIRAVTQEATRTCDPERKGI